METRPDLTETLQRMINVFNNSLHNMLDTYPDHIVDMRFVFNPDTGRREIKLFRVSQKLFEAPDADLVPTKKLEEEVARAVQPQGPTENC